MTVKGILSDLEREGTAQNRKIYGRHGVTGEMFGVSYGNQEKLSKRIRKAGHTELAIPLWDSGNHDAKILATKILQADALNRTTANQLAGGVTHSLQASGLAAVIAETKFAPELAEKWTELSVTRSHWKVFTGWALVGSIALAGKHHKEIADDWFNLYLENIEDRIHESPNEIRDQMNRTLIAIGSRNEALRDLAIAKAGKIGKVEVDHGETSCKTPDAETYIRTVWARKK